VDHYNFRSQFPGFGRKRGDAGGIDMRQFHPRDHENVALFRKFAAYLDYSWNHEIDIGIIDMVRKRDRLVSRGKGPSGRLRRDQLTVAEKGMCMQIYHVQPSMSFRAFAKTSGHLANLKAPVNKDRDITEN